MIGGEYFPDLGNTRFLVKTLIHSEYRVAPRENRPGHSGNQLECPGFLLESYDKNHDRFTLFGVETAEIIRSKGQSLEILHDDGISIIEELKKASPRLGNIESKLDLTTRMAEYQVSVDAVSCLTEEDHFLGASNI